MDGFHNACVIAGQCGGLAIDRALHDRVDGVILAVKRWASSQHLVQNRRQRELVCARVGVL